MCQTWLLLPATAPYRPHLSDVPATARYCLLLPATACYCLQAPHFRCECYCLLLPYCQTGMLLPATSCRPRVSDLAAASTEEVNNMWTGLGYYR